MSSQINFLRTNFGTHWGSQVFCSIFAVLFGGTLLRLCWVFGGENSIAIAQNVLMCLIGSLLGWAIGMFFSPFDKADSTRLEYLGKTIAAFASGYVLSKAEPLISAATDRIVETPETIQWNNVGLFVSAFLLAAIVVFVSRSYALKEESISALELRTREEKGADAKAAGTVGAGGESLDASYERSASASR
ncbi:hypothetical protein [Polaromonas sp. YR568]|uniref:hypothetical protein n=1 Tax=Polaromonas sp. YR568 TaxID=1855301 RepID=UPI00398C1BDE